MSPTRCSLAPARGPEMRSDLLVAARDMQRSCGCGPGPGACSCNDRGPERPLGHELARVLGARRVADLQPARAKAPACGVSADEMGDEAVAAVFSATEDTLISDTEVASTSSPAKSEAPEPPHAGSATIVCDGKDGYRVSLGGWAGAPCGTESCVTAHEEQHIKDWKGRWPEGCKGKPDGGDIPLGGDGYDEFLKKSECSAHTVDLACATKLEGTATGDCKAKVKKYVELTTTQKANYC